jgi:curved DNA-binding protein CbpA
VFAEETVEERHEAAATTEELLLRAVELMPEEAVREALGDTRRPLGLALNPDFDHELSQTDAYILSRVDGKTSAAEVLQLVASSSENPERRLLGLILTGVVALLEPAAKAPPAPSPRSSEAEAPPSAPPEGAAPAARTVDAVDEEAKKRAEPRRSEVLAAYEALAHLSHFEVLGVTDTASDHEIKQAFFQKAKKYHPDQYRDPGFADIVDRIEAVFLRIGGAYEVLRDPESRRSYEAVLKRRRAADAPRPPVPSAAEAERPAADGLIDTAENAWMAEEAIHRAERLIADGKVWDAIQLLQAVVPRIFGRKQRDRARVLLAKAYIKNPNWVRRGEELLQTVVQEDAQNAEAHFTLGLLYKESGLTSRALAMFKKTIELKPEHRQAQAELNALSGPAFLRKLFGKG